LASPTTMIRILFRESWAHQTNFGDDRILVGHVPATKSTFAHAWLNAPTRAKCLPMRFRAAVCLICCILLFSSCSTSSLVEIARRRQATGSNESRNGTYDVRVPYEITDWDVLNYTDEVKRKLANRANIHASLRFGSATGQVTLAGLAAATQTAGWGVS